VTLAPVRLFIRTSQRTHRAVVVKTNW